MASNLPPRIAELVQLIGIDAVLQLVQARLLGREWRVGATHDCEFWRAWSDVIGEGLTETVRAAWVGCDAIYLANCSALLRAEQHRQIVARYDALVADGMGSRAAIHQLCREKGYSDRWLRSIINRPTPPPAPEDAQLLLGFQFD